MLSSQSESLAANLSAPLTPGCSDKVKIGLISAPIHLFCLQGLNKAQTPAMYHVLFHPDTAYVCMYDVCIYIYIITYLTLTPNPFGRHLVPESLGL